MVRTLGCLSALCLLGAVACVAWIVSTPAQSSWLRTAAGVAGVLLPAIGAALAIRSQRSEGRRGSDRP